MRTTTAKSSCPQEGLEGHGAARQRILSESLHVFEAFRKRLRARNDARDVWVHSRFGHRAIAPVVSALPSELSLLLLDAPGRDFSLLASALIVIACSSPNALLYHFEEKLGAPGSRPHQFVRIELLLPWVTYHTTVRNAGPNLTEVGRYLAPERLRAISKMAGSFGPQRPTGLQLSVSRRSVEDEDAVALRRPDLAVARVFAGKEFTAFA